MTNAVMFSGGAALAAFEVGVMKALANGYSLATAYTPLVPDIVCGTSAGAFNAALLASHGNADIPGAAATLEEIWRHEIPEKADGCGNGVLRFRTNPSALLNPACLAAGPMGAARTVAADSLYLAGQTFERARAFFNSSGTATSRLLNTVDVSVLVSGEPFRLLMDRVLNPAALRNTAMQLRVAATNWRTGTVKIFTNADMTDAAACDTILASSAMPDVFQPVVIDGEPYVDGGVSLNSPIGPAIDAGADTLQAIYVNPAVDAISAPQLSSTMNTIYRLLAVTLATSFDNEIRRAERINLGLKILKYHAKGGQPIHSEDMRGAVEILGADQQEKLPYRHITIHRHFMTQAESLLDWLNFSRAHVDGLIEKGFEAAVEHDCTRNRCIGI